MDSENRFGLSGISIIERVACLCAMETRCTHNFLALGNPSPFSMLHVALYHSSVTIEVLDRMFI